MSGLEAAVSEGKRLGKLALYFGCWHSPGHFLHDTSGHRIYHDLPNDFPWSERLLDTGLLRNGKIPDSPDGRVFWTAGGKALWYAFYWWDRSVDRRGQCNSGIYVRGFGWPEPQAAFDYGCSQFPKVIQRQRYPLVLQNRDADPKVRAA